MSLLISFTYLSLLESLSGYSSGHISSTSEHDHMMSPGAPFYEHIIVASGYLSRGLSTNGTDMMEDMLSTPYLLF